MFPSWECTEFTLPLGTENVHPGLKRNFVLESSPSSNISMPKHSVHQRKTLPSVSPSVKWGTAHSSYSEASVYFSFFLSLPPNPVVEPGLQPNMFHT